MNAADERERNNESPRDQSNRDESERDDTERGEHPTDVKQRIQQREPHDDRVRDRGADTGGGKLRP